MSRDMEAVIEFNPCQGRDGLWEAMIIKGACWYHQDLIHAIFNGENPLQNPGFPEIRHSYTADYAAEHWDRHYVETASDCNVYRSGIRVGHVFWMTYEQVKSLKDKDIIDGLSRVITPVMDALSESLGGDNVRVVFLLQ